MRIASVLLAAGVAAGFAGAALAEEPDTTPTSRLWSLQITPYLWASGISGDISPFRRAPTIGIDKSFSDILDDLNFGGFVNVWARYDRFVFSADVMYVDTTDSHVTGPLPGYGPFPPGGNISADVDTTEFMSTIEAGYRLYASPKFTLDALAGARIWQISNTVTGTYSFAPFTVSHKESFGWVDPVIAARAFFSFTDRLSTMLQADVGGFGAGSDSTWQVLATVNYAFRPNMAISAGYKYLHVDYDKDGYVFDTDLSGPVLGFTYRF
jgi:opacity protein-like surface antigen